MARAAALLGLLALTACGAPVPRMQTAEPSSYRAYGYGFPWGDYQQPHSRRP